METEIHTYFMNRQGHEIHHVNTPLFENMNLCKVWPKDFKTLINKWRNTTYENYGVFWNENKKPSRNVETSLKQKQACLQRGKKINWAKWSSLFIHSDRKMQYCKNYTTTIGWGRTQSKQVPKKREERKEGKGGKGLQYRRYLQEYTFI